MLKSNQKWRLIAIFLLGFSCFFTFAQYPDRPIKMVVAYPPGGGTDIIARLIAPELGKQLGQSITIENRGGASGNIGTDSVVHSPPNGYTLLMGNIGPNAINVSIFKKLPYNPEKDLMPIALVAITPNVLITSPDYPIKSIADLIKLAKSQPGKINFPSAGNGTSSHLSGVLMNSMASIDMVHIPYKGGGLAITDLLGGQVQVYFATIPAAMPFIKSGKVKAIAVTSDQRSSALLDLPTIAESGLPGYSASTWYGLYAPKGTPNEIIETVHKALVEVLKNQSVKDQMLQRGFEVASTTPSQFATFIHSEIMKWAKVVKIAGLEPE
jgi:tripartite-type tricarboxylate transporter receptor subunit TctC